MIHTEAVENLLAYAEGSLAPELEYAVAAHAETCSACRDWLETYAILSQELPREDGHPSSSVLARYAVQPYGLSDVEAAVVEDHLEVCPECSKDLALVRSALQETGPRSPRRQVRSWSWSRLERHRQELVAAVLLVAIAVGVVVGSWLLRRPSELWDGMSFVEADAATAPETRELSGIELDGTRLIESHSNLQISDSKIKHGARVKIRAGGAVAFGDGFSVESGASLAVEGGPSHGPGKEPI